MKKRADLLLVERGLAATRQKAQSLIMSGNVLAEDVPVQKSGQLIEEKSEIRLRGAAHSYVSRGALKLLQAIREFEVNPQGHVALDVGASTGGFTEVLLEKGAKKVFAVDAGTNQMNWKLRSDSRVVVLEKTNARHLEYETIGEKVGIITMDVSFISVTKIFPALLQFTTEKTEWVVLVKPQFEVGKSKVGKGGIVASDELRQEALAFVQKEAEKLGLQMIKSADCETHGADGNREFLVHWRWAG